MLALSLGATLLGCVAEPGEAPAESTQETAGSITVARPLKLAPRARVPEKEAGFVSAEPQDHAILVTHDGRLAPFQPGEILGGTQGGGYLTRVESARSLDSTHFLVETTPAQLTEFITEGAFHVHYDSATDTSRIDVEDRGGERLGRGKEALKTSPGAPIRLLHVSHVDIPALCGLDVGGKAHLDVDADFTPVLDLDLEIGARGDLDPRPELKVLKVVASGQLDVAARLRGTGTVGGDCSIDLLDIAGGALSVPLPTLTFWVGPVPVIITAEVMPRARAEMALSFTRGDVDAEAALRTRLEAGVTYENGQWSTIWSPSSSSTGKASIGAAGPINGSYKVSAGAELRARLYGVVGPNLGLQAYARAAAESAPPYCTYAGRVDGGVSAYARAEAGVSVGPLELSLARLELVDLELLHFDGPKLAGKLRDAPECGGVSP